MKLSNQDGSLNLVDIRKKHESLLYNWINDCEHNAQIKNLAEYFLGPHLDTIWQYSLRKEDSVKIFKGDSFWHKLLHRWHSYSFYQPQDAPQVAKQIICNNSEIKINNQPIGSGKWIHNELAIRINDIWHEENKRFLTYEQLSEKYSNQCNWYEYQTVLSAIPRHWKELMGTVGSNTHSTKFELVWARQKVSHWVYTDSNQSLTGLLKIKAIWEKKLTIAIDIEELKKIVQNIYEVSSVTKLRNFQFRLLYNKIFCNDVLIHWNKVMSNLCDFCLVDKQTITHLLVNCKYVCPLWQKLQAKMRRNSIKDFNFNLESIILNTASSQTIVNLIVLIVKQYIYRCKCLGNKPNYKEIEYEIQLYYHIERYNNSGRKLERITKKWSTVFDCFLRKEMH